MRARWIIVLAAVCFVVVIGLPSICFHFIQQQIVWQMIQEELDSEPKSIYVKYVPVFEEYDRINPGSDKPYVVIYDFTARDYRRLAPYSLQISGKVNNQGEGTAYNGVLHVVAMNREGIAIDDNYAFSKLSPHTGDILEFPLHYNSSLVITNCTITLIYSNTG